MNLHSEFIPRVLCSKYPLCLLSKECSKSVESIDAGGGKFMEDPAKGKRLSIDESFIELIV